MIDILKIKRGDIVIVKVKEDNVICINEVKDPAVTDLLVQVLGISNIQTSDLYILVEVPHPYHSWIYYDYHTRPVYSAQDMQEIPFSVLNGKHCWNVHRSGCFPVQDEPITNIQDHDDGMSCYLCGEVNTYGQVNTSENRHICWSCRQDPYRTSIGSWPGYDE